MNWNQFRTVLWLRWRLTRNQWARSGGLGAALSAIAAVAGIALALAAGAGGVIGGAFGLAQAPPETTLLVWDVMVCVFIFFWLLGVIAEIQRSETIDFGRLLHLPVSLGWVFVVNYLASHVTLGVIIFLPGALGLCVGLLWKKGLMMLALIPLVLSFLFMVTAWTYCLRGWLVALMVNPRRRRNVMLGITLAMVLLPQLPNLYFNVYRRHQPKTSPSAEAKVQSNPPVPGETRHQPAAAPPSWLAAHVYTPPLWLPKGAMELSAGNPWPAMWGSLGALLLGLAGLARAYHSTIQFYLGREKSARQKPGRILRSVGVPKETLLDRRLPFLPAEVAGLTLACVRSLSRAPEVKMSLASNVVVLLILVGMTVSQHSFKPGDSAQLFVVTGACTLTFFSFLQLMFNQFGFDRDGFRAIILLPAPRRHVLLAKNLALAPVAFGLGIALLLGLRVVAHISWLILLAGLFQIGTIFLLLSLMGNFVSTVAPYRIAVGSLKPTKPSPKTIVMIFLSQMLFPVVIIPVFIPPLLAFAFDKWCSWPAAPIDCILSAFATGALVLLYRAILPGLGGLLERREKDILLVVSQEVE